MIRVLMIDHIVLRTAQVDEMVRFYSRVLGCHIERTLPVEGPDLNVAGAVPQDVGIPHERILVERRTLDE